MARNLFADTNARREDSENVKFVDPTHFVSDYTGRSIELERPWRQSTI